MLKERGLIINDEEQALEQLRIISYFRLANYLKPMEQDKSTHLFKPNMAITLAIIANERFLSSCPLYKYAKQKFISNRIKEKIILLIYTLLPTFIKNIILRYITVILYVMIQIYFTRN